ncbi:oligomeric Golgi complex subunit 6, partial [Phlyctochytrium arcticum]
AAALSLTNKLTKSNPLSRKLSKTLDISLEDAETREALDALAEFYKENTLATRRNLRGDIERRVMITNERFLQAFDVVGERVNAMAEELAVMNDCYQEMEIKLQSTSQETAHLMKQTQELRIESQRCAVRHSIVEVFLERFTLSDAQVHTLTAPNEAVGPAFFEGLNHLQKISDDCKVLLVTEHQEAGLGIMEKMASYQEAAFEKLFRWAQLECRSLNRESPEVTRALRDAMRALKERPVLFQTCIDEISNIRCTAMVRSFLDALTRGGPGGFPRPIELHAPDPQRYVGDMLAWLHQAVTEEREILEAVFDVKGAALKRRIMGMQKQEPSTISQVPGPHSADEEAIMHVLDRNLEGTCRPLKMRVEQVLATQEDSLIAYRIANLIRFYESTIRGVLGPDAQLTRTVNDLTETAYKYFFETLNTNASQLLRFVQTPGADLLPPQAVRDTVLQLREIMAIYDESIVSTEKSETDFAAILSALLDPLMQMCVLGAASLPTFDNAIYIINCLHHIQSALNLYSFTETQSLAIDRQIDSQVDVLVSEEYANVLNISGLHPLTQLDPKDYTAAALQEAFSYLDKFLYEANMEVSHLLGKLTRRALASIITQRAFRLFVQAYAQVYERIASVADQHDPPLPTPRSVEEVETLLSLE